MREKTKLGIWYDRWIDRWIPAYGIFSLIACFVWNSLIYTGTQILMGKAHHYDLTTELDRQVPFRAEWIFIYLVCSLFWAVNYILIVREGKEQWFRFATADIMSRMICGVFFILLPTTNVRPEVTGSGLASELVRFVYGIDAPTNLFPSIHCLVSWFCFIGIRKSRKIPKGYKIFSAVFALLVCASTQFTKQHYLVDVAAGIILAEGCYYIACRSSLYLGLQRVFGCLERKIFGENRKEREQGVLGETEL